MTWNLNAALKPTIEASNAGHKRSLVLHNAINNFAALIALAANSRNPLKVLMQLELAGEGATEAVDIGVDGRPEGMHSDTFVQRIICHSAQTGSVKLNRRVFT